MLKDLDLKCIYDSSEHNLIEELIIPLLRNSKKYFRGVGFFSSSWLKIASKGLIQLIENGGIGKIVLSPILSRDDWAAFKLGDMARQDSLLKKSLEKEFNNIEESLEKDTLNVLSWMISDGILEFKFAIPKSESFCDYHDKVAVFVDENEDMVAIHGSFNDSMKASLNGEAFSVFKSWENGQIGYVDRHYTRLKKLLQDGNNQFFSKKIPEVAKQKLIRFRSKERPYELKQDIFQQIEKKYVPHCPLDLFQYQKEAIQKWEEANYSGIFEMATGTGKTITSLAAAISVYEKTGSVALLIIVPYLHLVKQWEEVCQSFGIVSINCCSEYKGWQFKAKSKIQDFNVGAIDFSCFIAVNQTASSFNFYKIFRKIKKDSFFLVADEVHYLGSKRLRRVLDLFASFKIGLSATPNRWFDNEGTKCIKDYFGSTCFSLPLSEAIGKYLTPYDYIPITVNLSEDEASLYELNTVKIKKMWAHTQSCDDHKMEESLKNLLIARSRIVAKAEAKNSMLLKHLKSEMLKEKENGSELKNTLIYAAPGNHREILKLVSDLGLKCHEFVHGVSAKDRERLLKLFSIGEIQVLVAIKCLDEGVDIPATERAYFLASTTNPKEFIQRRGRVLRKFKGKKKAKIVDFIVLPDLDSENLSVDSSLALIKREIARFGEFSREALNEFSAKESVFDTLNNLGFLDLLEKEPWEIYNDAQSIDIIESEILHLTES